MVIGWRTNLAGLRRIIPLYDGSMWNGGMPFSKHGMQMQWMVQPKVVQRIRK